MNKVYVGAKYCEKCDKYFRPLGSSCPDCEGVTEPRCVLKGSEQDPRAYTEQTNIAFKENVRYSAAMGVTDAGIENARKIHPQAEWKKFGNSWRPKIKNRTEKLKMMKQCGMSEYPPNYFNQMEGK